SQFTKKKGPTSQSAHAQSSGTLEGEFHQEATRKPRIELRLLVVARIKATASSRDQTLPVKAIPQIDAIHLHTGRGPVVSAVEELVGIDPGLLVEEVDHVEFET